MAWQKERILFQPLFFRGKLAIIFKEGETLNTQFPMDGNGGETPIFPW